MSKYLNVNKYSCSITLISFVDIIHILGKCEIWLPSDLLKSNKPKKVIDFKLSVLDYWNVIIRI